MAEDKIRCAVVGAGPVGALAALYAARRGYEVDVYELRGGMSVPRLIACGLVLTLPRSSGCFDNTTKLYEIHQSCSLRTRHQCNAPLGLTQAPRCSPIRNDTYARQDDSWPR
jgi:hypothetical protein